MVLGRNVWLDSFITILKALYALHSRVCLREIEVGFMRGEERQGS